MRTLAVLLAAAAAALCSSTLSGELRGRGGLDLPETDMILDSYIFTPGEQMDTVPASFGDYAVIDDFTYGTDAQAELYLYTTWGVTTSASSPLEMALLVVDDYMGVPQGEPISQESYPVDISYTGYMYYGYPVWQAEMDLSYYWVEVSTPVWLGPQRTDGKNWYVLGGVTVSGSEGYRTLEAGWDWQPFSESIPTGDIFKLIEGYSYALQRTTWGGIKALLQ